MKTAGYGLQFTFGNHDSKGARPGSYEDPTKKSSCMTTEEGPVDSRFEYCDTQKVNLSQLLTVLITIFLKFANEISNYLKSIFTR